MHRTDYRNTKHAAYLDPSHRFAAVVIYVHVNGDRITVRVDRAIQPRLQPYPPVAQQERLLHRSAGARVLWNHWEIDRWDRHLIAKEQSTATFFFGDFYYILLCISSHEESRVEQLMEK